MKLLSKTWCILSCLAFVGCNTNIQNFDKSYDADQAIANRRKELEAKIEKTANCEEIIHLSKETFLTLEYKYISWLDESKTVFCWTKAIQDKNIELENLLYERLLLRYNEVVYGDFKFINTNRINDVIFTELATEKMLYVAIKFSSIDTCIYYRGQGPSHYGYIGLHNLVKMLDQDYIKKYDAFFRDNVLLDSNLMKSEANTCEFMDLLYERMFAYINNDYKSGQLKLRQTNIPVKND